MKINTEEVKKPDEILYHYRYNRAPVSFFFALFFYKKKRLQCEHISFFPPHLISLDIPLCLPPCSPPFSTPFPNHQQPPISPCRLFDPDMH